MATPGDGAAPMYRGIPVAQLLADYRLALISRCIDDREITLQKQSRGFFHISGAGNEALCLGLARSLRPAYDWFFPYYRDRSLVLFLGVSPTDMLLQAVGAANDPASGGRQMPCHFGSRPLNIVTQSSPTGSQCLPAVGCAEAGRYITAHRHELSADCTSHDDEVTYVSMGEGATSEGEFWESLNTACTLRLPVLYVIADNGYAISVPASQQSPGPISTLVRLLSRPGRTPHGRARLLRGARQGPGYRGRRPPGARPGAGACHRDAAVLSFVGRYPKQVPAPVRARRRGGQRPHCPAGAGPARGGRASS